MADQSLPPPLNTLTLIDTLYQYSSPPWKSTAPTPAPRSLHDVKQGVLKTQKAKGYYALGKEGGRAGISSPNLSSCYILPHNHVQLNRHSPISNSTPYFARPCPVTPRHGFVDSRPVHSLSEAEAAFAEARREDPDAELLLTPVLSGKFSGVATNMGVTWGLGNDGVTAGGKGATALIPTPFTTPRQWTEAFHLWNVPIEGVPYVELVENDGVVHAVQYRDGPPLPATQDYIPRTTTAHTILWPDKDLLAWEAKLKGLGNIMGVVVQLPIGSALSSHAAVHAIALGIPAVNSHHVLPGEVLKPSKGRPKHLKVADYQALAEGIRAWQAFKPLSQTHSRYASGPRFHRTLLTTAVATIHGMAAWDNSPHLLSLRAMAIPTLARYMGAAAIGELRHWARQGPGQDGESRPLTRLDIYGSREAHYEYALGISLTHLRDKLITTKEDFMHPGWEPIKRKTPRRRGRRIHKKFAYGGPKWAEVAQAGISLIDATKAFTDFPTARTWGLVTVAANNAIHTAHNGGFALSKWVNNDDFCRIACAPAYGFMNATAAKIALGLLTPEST